MIATPANRYTPTLLLPQLNQVHQHKLAENQHNGTA
jgi:hypothetical protein